MMSMIEKSQFITFITLITVQDCLFYVLLKNEHLLKNLWIDVNNSLIKEGNNKQ